MIHSGESLNAFLSFILLCSTVNNTEMRNSSETRERHDRSPCASVGEKAENHTVADVATRRVCAGAKVVCYEYSGIKRSCEVTDAS